LFGFSGYPELLYTSGSRQLDGSRARRTGLDFVPFTMAHTPLKMTIEEAHAELNYGWAHCYSPEALARAVAAWTSSMSGIASISS